MELQTHLKLIKINSSKSKNEFAQRGGRGSTNLDIAIEKQND
jgi:hypothetical protein